MKKIKSFITFITSSFICFLALCLPYYLREFMNCILFFIFKPVKNILIKLRILPKGLYEYLKL